MRLLDVHGRIGSRKASVLSELSVVTVVSLESYIAERDLSLYWQSDFEIHEKGSLKIFGTFSFFIRDR